MRQSRGVRGLFAGFLVILSAMLSDDAVAVSNDAFQSAAWLDSCGRQLVGARVDDATLEPGEPPHGLAQPVKSLWWRWQAPVHGRWAIRRTAEMSEDVVFEVYQGDRLSELRLVGRGTNLVETPMFGGDVYSFAVVVDATMQGVVAFECFQRYASSLSVEVPGNLLENPSFEDPSDLFACWKREGSENFAAQRGSASADGISWVTPGAGLRMSQEVDTVVGDWYEVRLAMHGDPQDPATSVRLEWGETVLGADPITPKDGTCWYWLRFEVPATQERTPLAVQVLSGWITFDAFSVVRVTAPHILSEPVSRSVLAGSHVVFSVQATGGGDLSYQWYFENQPLVGERGRSLTLRPVRAEQAGQYHVEVSNEHGRVSSAVATLAVEIPTSPVLLLQPWGGRFPAGSYHALSVLAVGEAPLAYQWYQDGAPVPEGTSRDWVLESIAPEHAGSYQVEVSNAFGSVWSLPVTIEVESNSVSGACVLIDNGAFLDSDAPVFDVDGITPLSGAAFVAQLYAGRTAERLLAVGSPRPFFEGPSAGMFSPGYVQLPGVQPGELCWVQIRVWEASYGTSYEQARALGGRYGRSEILELTVRGPMIDCSQLEGLEGFQLEAGRPQFNVGRLEVLHTPGQGKPNWRLEGEPGCRYLIERSQRPWVWSPWQVVTNSESGTLVLPEAPYGQGEHEFFRARILD